MGLPIKSLRVVNKDMGLNPIDIDLSTSFAPKQTNKKTANPRKFELLMNVQSSIYDTKYHQAPITSNQRHRSCFKANLSKTQNYYLPELDIIKKKMKTQIPMSY